MPRKSTIKDKEQKYTGEIPNTPLRFLWYVTKPFKGIALIATLTTIFAAAWEQSVNLFFKFIVDAIEQGQLERVVYLGLLYPVVVFVIQIVWRISSLTGMRWILRVEEKSHNDLSLQAFKHSHAFFADRFAGSILSKVSNVTNAANELINYFLWEYLENYIAILVSFALIWCVDPISSYIFALLAMVLVVINVYFTPLRRNLSHKSAEQSSKLRGLTVDIFSNMSAVRQFTSSKLEQKNIRTETKTLRNIDTKTWIVSDSIMILNTFILFVFSGLIFYFLTQKWSKGQISSGDLILVTTLLYEAGWTLIRLGRSFNHTIKSIGEASEGLEDLCVTFDIVDQENAKMLKIEDGEIGWNKVNFEYGENKVFKDFDLVIPAGQRVGLVGPSGAGKTTFVSLLLRQYDIDSGVIEIDGQNIATVTQDSLRENIAVVPQEPMLFHRSIKENIAYGNPNATMEEIIDVAKKAEAHDFITSLPEGYDTLVGERGVKLSGGQKQRVAIARAMLKDAPILVLDEATSALDSESEVEIQKALHKLMEGKTVIAVAHRLSTLREMDRIIVLENGRIVEDGSHDALVEYGGTYARLWKHQAGGFLQD